MKRNSVRAQILFAICIWILVFPTLPRSVAAVEQKLDQASGAKETSSANSLSQILNADGTVERSNLTNGSYDAKGYRMVHTSSGAPRFIPEVAGDEYWDPQFGKNGVDGFVRAVAVMGTDIYIGGSGPENDSGLLVAKWNGNTWTTIAETPAPFVSVIYAMAVNGTDLYVGGIFVQINGVSAKNVAKWNGSAWSPLGSGVVGAVYAMVGNSYDIYFAGPIQSAGGVANTARVAVWNDFTLWRSVNPGSPPLGVCDIYAIAYQFGGQVYAAGENEAHGGCVWRGGEYGWFQIGNADGRVTALAVNDSEVYAGGYFGSMNNVSGTSKIAKWNGSSWSGLGNGVTGGGQVASILINGSDVYAAGQFFSIGGNPADNVAKWNGTSWSAMGSGFNNNLLVLAISGSDIYVGGYVSFYGTESVNHIAKWSGSAWTPLRDGLNGGVNAVTVLGNDVYVGGLFTSVRGIPGTRGIVKWNGTTQSWSSVGGGLNGNVFAMTVRGTSLYVAGSFTSIPGGPGVAKWDGTDWSSSCSGVTGGQVSAIGVDALDRIYLGGDFTSAGGVPSTSFLARCVGNQWEALGSGVNNPVNAMVVASLDVYVGGSFTTAGGVPNRNRIAMWNGDAWLSLGNGANNQVLTLARDTAGNLYAGGLFTSMAGVPNTVHIAKWNGSWSALGSGINGNVFSIGVGPSGVYAGGQFTSAGGNAANDIAVWKSGAWSALGSGTNAVVRGIAQLGSSVFVGGGFSVAGNKPSYFFGRYKLPGSTPFDFDGDAKSDVSIFRPGPGEWWISRSGDGGNNAFQFGAGTDRIVPADFTGDGKTDVAFWRPSTGEWYIIRSENNSFYAFPFGTSGDIPAPGDYDGDGLADPAVFRPSTATWYIPQSSNGGAVITVQFGSSNDKPITADYDGDGKSDVGIFRANGASGASEWWIQRSTAGLLALSFGSSTDRAVPGDYTGDGKADVAIWHPSNGQWSIVRSEDMSFYGFPFGANGDIPVSADYDGDGKFDPSVFRPASAQWFITRSSGGTSIIGFGINGDLPLESAFVR